MAAGRTIGEIAEVLYGQELRRGGSDAEIGLWKPLFVWNVAKAVVGLADRGFLILDPPAARGVRSGTSLEAEKSRYRGEAGKEPRPGGS